MPPPVIVLIEDNPHDARWFWIQLREAGVSCDIITFATGEAALQGLREIPAPDLIVADWRLPVLEGAELIREIKRLPALESVPVIVLSALADRRDAALQAGARWCLSKPLGIQGVETLISLVQMND